MTTSFGQLATPEQVFEAVCWAVDSVENDSTSNRRISERTAVYLPVQLQLLDENSQFVGESFPALTRDISVGGVGLICDRNISNDQMTITFESNECREMPLLVDVHYSNGTAPYFFVGVSFCADWSTETES